MPDGIDAFNQSPGIGIQCSDCGAHFNISPSDSVDNAACSECGGKRFFRIQPSPVHDDLSGINQMKDMPGAAGSDNPMDTGGSPLTEGSIVAALVANLEAPGLGTDEIDQYGIPIRREPGTMAPNPGDNPDLARGIAGFPLSEGTIVGEDGEPSPYADTHGYDGYTHSHITAQFPNYNPTPGDMYPDDRMNNIFKGPNGNHVFVPNPGSDGGNSPMQIAPTDVTHLPVLPDQPWVEPDITQDFGPVHQGGQNQSLNTTKSMNTHRTETLSMEPYAPLWSDEHVAGLGGLIEDAAAAAATGFAGLQLGLDPAADAAAGGLDAAALGRAAPNIMKGVGFAKDMFGGGQGASQGGMFPSIQAPTMQQLGSTDIPMLLTADLETPSSVKSVDEQHDDPQEQDQKEFDDGDKSPSNLENPNNEDSGASGEDGVRDATPGYGFGPNSPAIQHAMSILPLLLHYITNGLDGTDDPILQDLHKKLDSENPGYLNKEHPDGPKVMEMIIQKHGQPKTSRLATVPLAPYPSPATSVQSQPMPGSDQFPIQDRSQTCPVCNGIINADGTCPQCFLPGTLIRTQGGYKAIEDIVIGDKVLSETGWNSVTEVLSREHHGSVLKINVGSMPEPILVTKEHPFKALVSKAYGMNVKKYRDKSDAKIDDHDLDWVRADQLTTEAYLVTNVPEVTDSPEMLSIPSEFTTRRKHGQVRKGPSAYVVDDEFAWMLGMYVAEGHSHSREIGFGLHVKETEYQLRLTNFFESHGFTTNISKRGDNGVAVIVPSSTLAEWMPSITGRGSHNKMIPEVLVGTHVEDIIVQGIFNGDGADDYNCIKQTSKILALQLMEHALQTHDKRIPRISVEHPQNKKSTYKLNPFYEVDSNVGHTMKTWKYDDKFLYRVDSIEEINYCGPVYNLEVENDHSYTVGNILVHNCGFPSAGTGIPNNQAPAQVTAAGHQGPQTPEQFEAASQYLTQNGQQGLVQQLYQHPENFGWLMNEIQQNPQPTAPLVPPSPAPQAPMPDPSGAMPVMDPSQPGGGGGQPMQPMSNRTADANNSVPRCPRCDSATTSIVDTVDGDSGEKAGQCHSCGNVWNLDDSSFGSAGIKKPKASSVLIAFGNPALDPQALWSDKNGNPIQEGDQYSLYTAGVPVPDEVTVLAKKPGELQLQLVGTSADFRIRPDDLQNGKYSFEPATNSAAFNNEIPKGQHPLDNANVVPEPTTDEVTNQYPNAGTTSSVNEYDDDSCRKCGSSDIYHIMSSPTTEMHECYKCSHVWETQDNTEFVGEGYHNANLDWIRNDDSDFGMEMERYQAMRDASGSSRNIHDIADRDPRLAEIRQRLDENKRQIEAGKHFTQSEKRELIDEHGHARNFGALDLSNTHYILDEDRIAKDRGNGMNVPDSHLLLGL